jgi:16S rRNA (uracil1498-N3)-methyltransferase
VLRAVDGDAVEIADSSGRRFDGSVCLDEKTVRVRLDAQRSAPPVPKLSITLAQGLPKGQKMEFVVEKATELGVARIVPFASARSAGDTARSGKVERWRRIAKTAAEQCGRFDVPEIEDPIDFDSLVKRIAAEALALFPWELAPARPLRETLPGPRAGFRARRPRRRGLRGPIRSRLGRESCARRRRGSSHARRCCTQVATFNA